MRKSKKQGTDAVLKFSEHKRKRVDELQTDLDALFRLPLAEFTGARNALAVRLKKSGRVEDAVLVKALAKPPISAWAVNQLYWNHREDFDQLIASGERFHKAQTSRAGAKAAEMREALDERREALTQLTDLATSLLRNAGPNQGQNPSPEVIRRITTTLEGISANASRSEAPRPGRLSADVDPPGFESFASFAPAAGLGRQKAGAEKKAAAARRQAAGTPTRLTGSQKAGGATSNKSHDDARELAESRKAKVADAKVSLQDAKRLLTKARAKAQSLEATQKKADAEAQKAEKHRRVAEQSLQKAKAASEDAARRARSFTVELDDAASEVGDAERAVEEAGKELDSLLRES